MKFFNETKTRLAFLGLGTNQFIRIAGKNIPRTFVRLILILFPLIFYILEVALCIKLSDNIKDGFLPIAVTVACFPATPIYISLVLKTNEIDEVFIYLENVFNTSNAKLIQN